MTTTLQLTGVPEALRAFDNLPRRIRLKHTRIALSAAGGVVKKQYVANVAKVTGVLSKSVAVKVVIPDSSYNAKHHGRPSVAIIGVKRNAGKFMRRNRAGNLRGYGAANRALKANRRQLVNVSGLQRETAAKRLTQQSFPDAVYRGPSRYAHLAGPGRRGADVINNALRQSQGVALGKFTEKIQQGIATEANALGTR